MVPLYPPVITNIYMEYFEKLALGPESPISTLGGKDMSLTQSR